MPEDSFRAQFSHYVAPDQSIKKRAFSSGLIVLDANVLLDLYRYTREGRAELLGVIERLRARIWVPHQVAEEFYSRRTQVMADLRTGYANLREQIERSETKLIDDLNARINQLDNRVHLREEERKNLHRLLQESFAPIKKEIENLQQAHRPEGSYSEDPLLTKLEELLSGKVGQPFSDRVEEHLAEAQRRIERKEPPGYCDADKDSNSHGDYFVWLQSLQQAKAVSAPVLLIVTGDQKEDWYLRINNQPICARPELSKEAAEEADTQLVILSTSDFLELSKQYAQTSVSTKTIREAADLPRKRAEHPTAARTERDLADIESEIEIVRTRLDMSSADDGRLSEAIFYTRSEMERTDDPGIRDELVGRLYSLTEEHDAVKRAHASDAAALHLLERQREVAAETASRATLRRARLQDEVQAARNRARAALARSAELEAELGALESSTRERERLLAPVRFVGQ